MKKKILKLIKIIFIAVFVLVSSAGGCLYYFLNKSLPTIDGKIAVVGLLEKDVIVIRDYNGIPTITAENDRDLYKAQGFIQAQDRLFQMDMARRQASGKLSEVIGRAAINNDKKFLTFSLRKAAEKSYNEAYSN